MPEYGITSAALLRALPQVPANDERLLVLAKIAAQDAEISLADLSKLLIFPAIDTLPEDLLDELAYDFKVDWCDYDAPLKVKREVIKSAKQVHMRLGTKWAVERVIAAYFGNGSIQEWFEYGGEPHHFKITTTNLALSNSLYIRFLTILNAVKRKSAWLDEIIEHAEFEVDVYHGVASPAISGRITVKVDNASSALRAEALHGVARPVTYGRLRVSVGAEKYEVITDVFHGAANPVVYGRISVGTDCSKDELIIGAYHGAARPQIYIRQVTQ